MRTADSAAAVEVVIVRGAWSPELIIVIVVLIVIDTTHTAAIDVEACRISAHKWIMKRDLLVHILLVVAKEAARSMEESTSIRSATEAGGGSSGGHAVCREEVLNGTLTTNADILKLIAVATALVAAFGGPL